MKRHKPQTQLLRHLVRAAQPRHVTRTELREEFSQETVTARIRVRLEQERQLEELRVLYEETVQAIDRVKHTLPAEHLTRMTERVLHIRARIEREEKNVGRT